MGDTVGVTKSAPAPRDIWGPPGQARPSEWQPPQQQPPQYPFVAGPPAGYPAGPPVDAWLNTGAYPAGGYPVPPPQPNKPVKVPREPLQPAAIRLVAGVGLIVTLIAATLAAGLTAVYDRNHLSTVSLTQSGAALPGSPAPGSIAGIAAAVLPSVVTVKERTATIQGTGSGVVINGAKGLILTNDHVIADAKAGPDGAIEVVPPGGTDVDAVPASIVGVDPLTDLAVIHVATTALKTATLGRSSALRVGDAVVAIGAPLDLEGTVTSGIVSYLGRVVPVPSETGSGSGNEIVGAIQTDAAINPGNSGGALVDSLGRVIGINSAIASTSDGATTPTPGTGQTSTQSGNIGVGFAIPIDQAIQVAAQLIVSPHVATHPFLGVRTQDNMTPAGAKVSTVGSGSSSLPAVTPGSPADKAGLRDGDVITAIDGDSVDGADSLLIAIRKHRASETITIAFSRGGRAQTAKAVLANSKS